MIARDTKQVIRRAAAQLTGKVRGPDQRVRRNSYDVDDARARVFSPIGDGTVRGALGWIEDLLKAAKEFDQVTRHRDGGRGPITPYGITVLEALLTGNVLDFKTGRLEPAIAWIETVTGFARKTVVDALARLKRHGFLDWVRRSQRTGNDEGPQREQVTNAYFFDIGKLPARVLQRFRDLRERRHRRLGNAAATSVSGRPVEGPPLDPELEAILGRLGAMIPSASSD